LALGTTFKRRFSAPAAFKPRPTANKLDRCFVKVTRLHHYNYQNGVTPPGSTDRVVFGALRMDSERSERRTRPRQGFEFSDVFSSREEKICVM